ncbi:MAG: PIN domain-containing protein [Thermoplasmata archaeon]|nr:PIN domain-containing protein [Thermoplasmata archaeon]
MLLDTNFLIDLLDGRPEAVDLAAEIDREGSRPRLPAPALFELWRGAARAVRRENERTRIEELVAAFEAVEFDSADARSAGFLQAELARSGKILGTVDVQLAGMALARAEALVTGDRALAQVGHKVPIRLYRRV